MNKVTKKIMALLLTLTMVFSMAVTGQAAVSNVSTSTSAVVTFSVEKFTIGQGYLVEPTEVKISEGDTVATVFEKVMKEKNMTYVASLDYGFYLSSINNADSGVVNIPNEIAAMPSVSLWNGQISAAPTTESNIGNTLENKGLGEGSYSVMSGWMFMINNKGAQTTANDIKVKAGDVIRLQFSVHGYGADLGYDTESYTQIKPMKFANKDVLTSKMANVAARSKDVLKNATVKVAYDNAMTVLTNYNPSQEIVDSAVKLLDNATKVYEDEQAKPEPVTTEQSLSVGRATIKSIKNVKKRKVKISVKKIANVTGYEFRYATNKKFNKAMVKDTKKAVVTVGKFKKKQRCYAKVRAYISVNGVKAYGKWSSVRTVKINK